MELFLIGVSFLPTTCGKVQLRSVLIVDALLRVWQSSSVRYYLWFGIPTMSYHRILSLAI